MEKIIQPHRVPNPMRKKAEVGIFIKVGAFVIVFKKPSIKK